MWKRFGWIKGWTGNKLKRINLSRLGCEHLYRVTKKEWISRGTIRITVNKGFLERIRRKR